MIIGSGLGSAVSCIALSFYMFARLGYPVQEYDLYVSAALILLYIGSNTGFMVMPGIMVGELLPAQIRGQIAGYIFAFFNIALFGAAKLFPYAKEACQTQGLFLIFGISSLAATLLLYGMLPETRHQSLHDIEDYFSQRNWLWINRKRDKQLNEGHEEEKKKMFA
jgi:atypical protein kinase C iota type